MDAGQLWVVLSDGGDADADHSWQSEAIVMAMIVRSFQSIYRWMSEWFWLSVPLGNSREVFVASVSRCVAVWPRPTREGRRKKRGHLRGHAAPGPEPLSLSLSRVKIGALFKSDQDRKSSGWVLYTT